MSSRQATSKKSAVWDYINIRKQNGYDSELFSDICYYIADALCYWTGKTYVGCQKEKSLQELYQDFFLSLCSLIDYLSMENEIHASEKDMIDNFVFTGTVYRYLGKAGAKNRKHIIPQYNDTYVSWSKNPQSNYIESKLYGKCTWMRCEIRFPMYGIDIEGFHCFFNKTFGECILIAKGTEREVVFPTIEKYITEIKYI